MSTQIVNGPSKRAFFRALSESWTDRTQNVEFQLEDGRRIIATVNQIGRRSLDGESFSFEGQQWPQDYIRVKGEYNTHSRKGWVEFSHIDD